MFGHVGAYKCQYVVAIGALAGLTVSMFGSMFPMPRIGYAMAKDGLIFKWVLFNNGLLGFAKFVKIVILDLQDTIIKKIMMTSWFFFCFKSSYFKWNSKESNCSSLQGTESRSTAHRNTSSCYFHAGSGSSSGSSSNQSRGLGWNDVNR